LLVLFLVGCGSRGAVDSLGQPTPGVNPVTDGGPRDAAAEPIDVTAPMDRGSGFVDASVDGGEMDQSLPPEDRAVPEAGGDVIRDAGRDIEAADAGTCGPGLILCGKTCVNPLTDNDNCGVCNLKCNLFMSGDVVLGGCNNGLCTGAYGACFPADRPYFTCDEVCAREKTQCVQAGCMGFTHVEYQFDADCEGKVVMEVRTSEACNQPMQLASGYRAGRCCCAKRPGEKL
jgi:hypothetical protein